MSARGRVMHVVSWGARCNAALSAGLLRSVAEGETPAFLRSVALRISTDDRADIESRPGFARWAARFGSVAFPDLPPPDPRGDPYRRAAAAERAFVASAAGAVALFLAPDMIAGRRSLSRCAAAIEAGASLIAAAAIRCRDDAPAPGALPPAGLTVWSWRNAHPFTRRQVWGAAPAWAHAGTLFFPCAAGWVARCHHLHPAAIRVTAACAGFEGTIDDGLVDRADPARIAVADDSDRIAFAEISPAGKALDRVRETPHTAVSVRAWAAGKAVRPVHRLFFARRIVLRLRPGATDAADRELFG